MKEKLVGKTKEEAVKLLKESNSIYRIVEEEGEMYAVTMDIQTDRFNLSINNGVITDSHMG